MTRTIYSTADGAFIPGFKGRLKRIELYYLDTVSGLVLIQEGASLQSVSLPAAQVLSGAAPTIGNIATFFQPGGAESGHATLEVDVPILPTSSLILSGFLGNGVLWVFDV